VCVASYLSSLLTAFSARNVCIVFVVRTMLLSLSFFMQDALYLDYWKAQKIDSLALHKEIYKFERNWIPLGVKF
jgi:hypothetical protein